MRNFLEHFLHVTRHVESPTSYLEWAAYVTIAAVMRDNLWIGRGPLNVVYPNLYVLLVGDSGTTRKSTPLKAVNKMIKPVNNTKLIEGRASIQGVLSELAAIRNINGKTITGASCLLYSEEFAAFLVKDPQTTGVLTDIYDYKEEYRVTLKTQETSKLDRVCVSMLSATNAAFLQDMFSKTDLYGGLVGRTIFIMEEEARHKNSGMYDETSDDDWTPLSNHLVHLSTLKGKVRMTEEAIEYYDKWYINTDFKRHESKTGFEPRIGTYVLKLGLIVAGMEPQFDKLVEKRHVENAIDIITRLTANYKKLVATVNPYANVVISVQRVTTDIMLCLAKARENKIEHSLLMRTLIQGVDSDTLDKAVRTLEGAKLIEMIPIGNSINYQLTKHGRDMILSEMPTGGKVN